MEKSFYNQLKELLAEEKFKIEEPLSEHTTFKIGGPADYFLMPETVEELQEVLKLCITEKMPYYIMGNGSNLLVGDYGFRGVVIHISKHFNKVKFDRKITVTAGAGILLAKLASEISKKSLTGFEFAAGIPGTLGGAITMNAGAYGGEIKDCIVNALVMNPEGNVFLLSKEELELGYRTSVIQKQSLIVLEATFEFTKGDMKNIQNRIAELNARRREKQPLEFPSAGSTFKRPEGHFAGALIMDAGLRGYRVGDIMVSEKHCGFVINVGNGTAKQVRKLIEDVQSIIMEKYGVRMEPEVRFLGEF